MKLKATFTYTIILLIGIWINLTKKPIKPIIAKPIAVAMAIFWNSGIKKLSGSLMHTDMHCSDQRRDLSLQSHVNTGNTSKSAQMLRNKSTFSGDRCDFKREEEDFHKEGQSQSFSNKQNQKYPQWQFMEHLSHTVSFISLQALKVIANTASKMENLHLCLSQEDSTVRPYKNQVLGIFSVTLGQQPWSWVRRSTAPQKLTSLTSNEVPYRSQ